MKAKTNLIIGIAALCTGIGMFLFALYGGFLNGGLIGIDIWCVLMGILNLWLYSKARNIARRSLDDRHH